MKVNNNSVIPESLLNQIKLCMCILQHFSFEKTRETQKEFEEYRFYISYVVTLLYDLVIITGDSVSGIEVRK